jgi:hypothetical protein
VQVNLGYCAVNACYVLAAKEKQVNAVKDGDANQRGA